MNRENSHVVQCICGTPYHVLLLDTYTSTGSGTTEVDLIISFQRDSLANFFTRLKEGFLYILGYNKGSHHWCDVVISEPEIRELHGYLGKVLDGHGQQILNEEKIPI